MIGSRAGVKSAAIGYPRPRDPGEELGRIPLRPPDWTAEALCTAYSPEWWHSDDLGDQAEAVAVCTSCPVRDTCALAALESGEPYGVWGGLTSLARARIARAEGYPRPGAARHGTRSAYVADCRCTDCRRAHAVYEHARRIGHAGAAYGTLPAEPALGRRRVRRRRQRALVSA